MNRALRRQQVRNLQKHIASKMGSQPQAPPPPQRIGIGFTITNRELALVWGRRVYGVDWAALGQRFKAAKIWLSKSVLMLPKRAGARA